MNSKRKLLTVYDLQKSDVLKIIETADIVSKKPYSYALPQGNNVHYISESFSLVIEMAINTATCNLNSRLFKYNLPENHLTNKESSNKVAKMFKKPGDVLIFRLNNHKDVESASLSTDLSIINASTDKHYPYQGLVDLFNLYALQKNFVKYPIIYIAKFHPRLLQSFSDLCKVIDISLIYLPITDKEKDYLEIRSWCKDRGIQTAKDIVSGKSYGDRILVLGDIQLISNEDFWIDCENNASNRAVLNCTVGESNPRFTKLIEMYPKRFLQQELDDHVAIIQAILLWVKRLV